MLTTYPEVCATPNHATKLLLEAVESLEKLSMNDWLQLLAKETATLGGARAAEEEDSDSPGTSQQYVISDAGCQNESIPRCNARRMKRVRRRAERRLRQMLAAAENGGLSFLELRSVTLGSEAQYRQLIDIF